MADAAVDAPPPMSDYDLVVETLNKAQTATSHEVKIRCLKEVSEIIIHRNASLLDNFLEEMLGFQNDPSIDVRKLVISFIEEACKKDMDILSKIVANVMIMLGDKNVNIQKKVIMSSEHLYQLALRWVTKTRTVSEIMEQIWEYFFQLKNRILTLIDSDNEGVRMRVIKFIESCVLLQSCRTAESEELSLPDSMSLDQVPRDHRFISYRRLEAEGKTIFQKLVDFVTSQKISSINLITGLAALAKIVRQRPEFMGKAVVAFETVQVNLPPSLTKAQITSVRKELKKHLLAVLRHPSSYEWTSTLTNMLNDLGVTNNEIYKAIPNLDDRHRKRSRRTDEKEDGPSHKRARVEEDEDREDQEPVRRPAAAEERKKTAIDITADDLITRLSATNVADLVLLSVVMLPDVMPAQFQAAYTPIAAAGTPDQIRHLCRLMANQFTAAGLGPGYEQMKKKEKEEKLKAEAEAKKAAAASGVQSTSGGGSAVTDLVKENRMSMLAPSGFQQQKASKRLHQFGLAHITKPMNNDGLEKMSIMAFKRILAAERRVRQGGLVKAHVKLIVSISSQFSAAPLQQLLRDFIVADQKSRSDLAIAWIFQEYSSYQGYNNSLLQDPTKGLKKYDECLTELLSTLYARGDHREPLFHRIFIEAPQVTPGCLAILKKAAQDAIHGVFALDTLHQMIMTRPAQRNDCVALLLEFTTYENVEIRTQSLQMARELYENPSTKDTVTLYMFSYLRTLLNPAPPESLFGQESGRHVKMDKWEEDTIKACLQLHLHLLAIDHGLIHELAQVYVEAIPDIKRVILRQLENPIKAIGMHSPHLLQLVEACPKGAETLVTRIVHLLTERCPPSAELVDRIRDLYEKRVPDVRFLIPVLAGLNKKEIIIALPKLVKLNQNHVKEVFNRLLHGQSTEGGTHAVSPSELLIALHQIDPNNTDMKSLICASNLLLAERTLFTQEVLAGVIKQLVEQNPLPTLLMRTVLMALNAHPRLIGFLMNILQRLILKQVWKQPRVWEGFIRCCQKTKPQSFHVLLQLPAQNLQQVFGLCPDLREPLLQHINGLSANQQATISPFLMKVIQTDPADYGPDVSTAPKSGDLMMGLVDGGAGEGGVPGGRTMMHLSSGAGVMGGLDPAGGMVIDGSGGTGVGGAGAGLDGLLEPPPEEDFDTPVAD